MSSTIDPVAYTENENGSVTQAIIAAIAEESGCDPIELEPLYEYIDPDALNTIFNSRSEADTDHTETYLEFTYNAYRVAVTADSIHVSQLDE
ncbi:HalOD1 output domain-containing protein [Natrinema sp. HArc-T2]|uniref:HalOD1 output domain-containing protein n=1 Tax=Natrinema sp. HArc-T2 TaxID=3242701 RepID=UPI00359D8494